jgi:hypothetical protein
MSKKINTDDIANELATGSLFFGKNARPASSVGDETSDAPTPPTPLPARRRIPASASPPASTSASTPDSTSASTPDSTSASTPDSTSASTPDSSQASSPDSKLAIELSSTLASSGDLADAIYRVVKKSGKQPSFVRVTEREKAELADVLTHISETHGYKVTETELMRIALLATLADYAQHGIDSLLMRVIIALRD